MAKQLRVLTSDEATAEKVEGGQVTIERTNTHLVFRIGKSTVMAAQGRGHDKVKPWQLRQARQKKDSGHCFGCDACATDEPCPFEDEVPLA